MSDFSYGGAAPTTRRYCWRTGCVVELWPGEKCPECSSPGRKHWEVPDGICGRFAVCSDHGHPCILEPGHAGPCSTPGGCQEA